MERKLLKDVRQQGISAAELVVTMGIMAMVMGIVMTALVSTRKSVDATNHYLLETNNANRLVDYVGLDLSRAVRVGQLVGAVNTPFKTQSTFLVTETNTLTINIPDYYGSNTPTKTAGSSYRASRYARASPGASGYTAWADAVGTYNGVQLARFAPSASASDEIQVRYYRAKRSVTDGTICYFRQEFPASSNTALSVPVEVAEQVIANGSTTTLVLDAANNGAQFRIQSSFTPHYHTAGGSPAATNQMLDVVVRNPRRD